MKNEQQKLNSETATQSDQALVIAYLYQQLSEHERVAVEQRLESDQAFKNLMNSQRSFDQLVQPGTQPIIDDNRLEHVQWSLQRRLRKEANKQQSSLFKLAKLWQLKFAMPAQLGAMALTFVFGFFVAQSGWIEQQPSELATTAELTNNATLSPLDLIKNDDYQIVDLDLQQVNHASGSVKINFSLVSRSSIDGNMDNPEIQKLLTETMKDRVSDSTRLDLISLLKDYVTTDQVKESLTHSLLNDPNPGVRIVAAQTLAKLSNDKAMRDVLRLALKNDINPGVRVEVFQALMQHPEDNETVNMIRQFSAQDSNQYIRSQSNALLQDLKQANKSKTL